MAKRERSPDRGQILKRKLVPAAEQNNAVKIPGTPLSGSRKAFISPATVQMTNPQENMSGIGEKDKSRVMGLAHTAIIARAVAGEGIRNILPRAAIPESITNHETTEKI
ncbi:MAG: hypothetical protein NT106_14200 [Candidatus Sumerlaeota bacterium]|nr:hypothetical protein [Candidatus Sumerlaeota bacterium]